MTEISGEIAAKIGQAGRSAFGDGWSPSQFSGAPGRIELIGNHVDYNGGPVLAAAIDRRVMIGIADSAKDSIRAVFADVSGAPETEINSGAVGNWRSDSAAPEPGDYLRGVVAALSQRGIPLRSGVQLVVCGNLPFGIGISSSAALCVALVESLAQDVPANDVVVLIAQEAEHRAGSPCGTMDQSASVYGGLIHYEGSTGAVEPVSTDLRGHQFLVVNSGVVRSLAASNYPDRVAETRKALMLLRDHWRADLPSLGAIDRRDLDAALGVLESIAEPVLARRLRHVVTECGRVHDALEAVRGGDWSEFGALMTASGRSSAGDYQISHPMVEQIVSICLGEPGVLGARMMGGGQGGSALVLVRPGSMRGLMDRLDADYFLDHPEVRPEIRYLPCTFSEGAGRLPMPQAS